MKFEFKVMKKLTVQNIMMLIVLVLKLGAVLLKLTWVGENANCISAPYQPTVYITISFLLTKYQSVCFMMCIGL